MKKYVFILFVALLACQSGTSAQENESENVCQLTIHFTTSNITGKIYFLVFNSPENFGKEDNAYNRGIINPPLLTLSLPYGEYAVTCFQDTDNTEKMTTNFLGIPKEPVGTSNNPKLLRPPKWEDTVFKIDKPQQEITIELKKMF